jgi:hypothetical protein
MSWGRDRQWLEERAARKKQLIVAVEDAIAKLSEGAQSYAYDDGQGRVNVTRADLNALSNLLSELEGQLSELNTRLCGSASNVKPGF